MSAEGRRKIAEAQKARWAKQKKGTGKKVVAKKATTKRVAFQNATGQGSRR